MYTLRTLAGFIFLWVPCAVLAQSPYTISGLHSDLTLASAVAQAEKLGGRCATKDSRTVEQGKIVQCSFSHCSEPDAAGACGEAVSASAGLMFAALRITSIDLVAPDDAAPLTRIVMTHEGDTDAMAAGMIETFGPTVAGGAPTGKKTWSKARRWSWVQGQYRLGLLDSPQVIILATDHSLAPPAVEMQPETTP